MTEQLLETTIGFLYHEAAHVSSIFPDATNLTCTLTAGGVANTYGNWAEIQDSGATTFSSKFAAIEGHISAIIVEECSRNDKVYMFELGLSHDGTNFTELSCFRFLSGTGNVPGVFQIRYRMPVIPAGVSLYYRMMCETAGATAEVHFRYHTH